MILPDLQFIVLEQFHHEHMKGVCTESRGEYFLPAPSQQLHRNVQCRDRALMPRHALSTQPPQNKRERLLTRRSFLHLYVHNLLVSEENRKSAFTDRPGITQIEPSDVPKIIYTKPLPSYSDNGRELCFFKAMMAFCHKNIQVHQVLACTSISHTKSRYMLLQVVFFDHALRHHS